ncbi:DNA polymerase I [Adhaeribacter aquaticus]|uniref:DNA polymerase I n=1 Tax=Adhaeribacter aquaticus TaxID=299567 RepID=UPI00040E827D|nr:DNA polymerase I [Adhaeribacter aquaticus]
MKDKKLFLLDVMPLLYRAHFATMGKKFGTTTGIDTRTPLVFFNYILQVITEEKPDAIAAALDSRAKGRVEVASTYKANREKMPSEIYDAFPYAMRLLEALQIPVMKEEGYEADDVIAAMAKQGASLGYSVYIVSPDKDFAQLVTSDIFLFRPAYKGAAMETLDAVGVKNKYGVEPHQIADYLALRGDSVDNIPGIKGIGDKTAASLLEEYHSVEELIAKADTIKQTKVKEAIQTFREQLEENKFLALLTGELDVTINWEDVITHQPDESKLLPLLNELQFSKIKERLTRQGLISSDGSNNSQTEAPTVSLNQVNAAKAIQQLQTAKEVAVGFLENHPDSLYAMADGENAIYEINLVQESEWHQLISFLDQEAITKTGWQLKPLLKKINELNLTLSSQWTDLILAAYLLEPDAKIEWTYIRDKYQLAEFKISDSFYDLNYLPALPKAHKTIMSKIEEMELDSLLREVELPLEAVIARMELQGIRIDTEALTYISEALTQQLHNLEQQLHQTAGTKFNLNSPSKTAEILQQIADPAELKKTKTGQISTAEPFLIDLAPKYPFVADLLNYRKLNKIITNYVEALPRYINPTTGKIHPTFQQIVAGTGRLSCTDPNLQNLPIRNEAGREVRKAIVPSNPDFSIVSIDYNQVELRLLAALSEDPVMIESFRAGKDIHTTTASRIFKVAEDQVTKDMRSKAKGVNFGIAYGITPWGLSNRLKISQKEAKQVIEAYFQEFSSIQKYLEKSLAETREKGFTRTRYGRIRYIEGIDSRNGTTRKVAERMAVNAPLQGLAADIIKEAMVLIDQFLLQHKLRSRLILQVHDELVFDAADTELDFLIPEVTRIMESKADLLVPLKVEVTVGKNWLDQEDYKVLRD